MTSNFKKLKLVLVLYFFSFPHFIFANSYGDLRLSDDEVDFGDVTVEDSSSERVLLRWTGQSALWVSYDDSALPWDVDFDSDCPILLTPGMACYLEFEFNPSEIGEVDGGLVLRDRRGNELATIEIFGRAVPEEEISR